jgi:hypothetical protein
MNKKKIQKCLKQTLDLINNNHLTVEETVVLYGNIGYSIGLSVMKRTDNPPTIEELERLFYQNPTIDVSLMLTGLNVASWLDKKKGEKE